jgi:hypothetical protein
LAILFHWTMPWRVYSRHHEHAGVGSRTLPGSRSEPASPNKFRLEILRTLCRMIQMVAADYNYQDENVLESAFSTCCGK